MAKSKVKFKSNLKAIERLIYREYARRLKRIGENLLEFFADRLTGPRTGRWYTLPPQAHVNPLTGKRMMYQASAPGEYPAERLGDLVDTLDYFVCRMGDNVVLTIGSPMYYAEKLEGFGGFLDGYNSGSRPFLRRGILENLEEIKGLLGKPF